MTIKDIAKMLKENRLDQKYDYALDDLHDGFGVIRIKSKHILENDAIVCCKRIEECNQLLCSL